MQKNHFLFLSFFLLFTSSTFAKVEAKNYNFTLDKLFIFFPGSNIADIQKKYPKLDKMKSDGTLVRTYVIHTRYKFPVFMQVHEGVVVSFFARLPTYFLHDVFHQSLINRYGKQNRYKKVNSSALYRWDNAQGNKLIYKGECTLTCFPSYLYSEAIKKPEGAPEESLLKVMSSIP